MPAMPIYLDDQPLDQPGPDLGAALRTAAAKLLPTGRVVVEVRVDGQVVPSADLSQREGDATAGREVRLYSENPRELAAGALRDARAALELARQTQQEAADLFQQDDQRAAMVKVGGMVEIWQQSQQAVTQAAALAGVDLDTLAWAGDCTRAAAGHLAGQIRALHELIQAGDSVGLADALAYEWPATIDRWDGLIAELIRRIEE